MTTIAIVADSHYDSAPNGRLTECVRIHSWIAEDIAKRGVDLLIHTGDILERKSTAAERTAIADWLILVTDVCPTVLVRGNHDSPVGEISIFGRLLTCHPIIVEEGAAVHEIAGVTVMALSWPQKGQLLAATGDESIQVSEQSAADAIRNVLRGLGSQADAFKGPRVLAAHAQVRGGRVSTGQPLVGVGLEIGIEDLALCRADAYALGHIHCGQGGQINGAPWFYPGSPRRTSFGEVEAKGYQLLEFDGRTPVSCQFIETPCAGMQLFTADWNPATHQFVGRDLARLSGVNGSEVRVRYRVDSDQRLAARAAEAELEELLLRSGAVFVKIEAEVRPTSTARAPEIVAAKGLVEKLPALWTARNDVPEAPRAEQLLSRAVALEAEVSHAA